MLSGDWKRLFFLCCFTVNTEPWFWVFFFSTLSFKKQFHMSFFDTILWTTSRYNTDFKIRTLKLEEVGWMSYTGIQRIGGRADLWPEASAPLFLMCGFIAGPREGIRGGQGWDLSSFSPDDLLGCWGHRQHKCAQPKFSYIHEVCTKCHPHSHYTDIQLGLLHSKSTWGIHSSQYTKTKFKWLPHCKHKGNNISIRHFKF